MPKKDDAIEIEKIIDELSNQEWLKGIRSWWPSYVFHYTDIRNAVEILRFGKLLCREVLNQGQNMIVDNASRQVMANTDEQIRNFVRLYFRPKTPTQYRNEGMRPQNQRQLDSHCPVPIFFLFDSKEILTRNDCKFSQGNLATTGTQGLCSSAEELRQFDFKKIYHTGVFSSANREIIFHRNAEVVIPNELDLTSLRYIFCRSSAEKDTLLHLLPEQLIRIWGRKILIASKSQIFNCKWTFIETVELSLDQVLIKFSPDTETPEPFEFTATLHDIITRRAYRYHVNNLCANTSLILKLPEGVTQYRIEVKLDDNLAFANSFDEENTIF